MNWKHISRKGRYIHALSARAEFLSQSKLFDFQQPFWTMITYIIP